MTRTANEQISTDNLPEQQDKCTQLQSVEIVDPVFEETYTAHIQRNGANWIGWIPDVPKVKCEEPTEKALLKNLETKLHETLVAEEEEWEQKFEADVKAGKFDKLREEALEDVKAGRFKYL